MGTENTLLDVHNLSKHFAVRGGLWPGRQKKVYAVDRVSLRVKRGETLGLVGESGCGKSTLGRTILRLYEPTSGQVSFNGHSIFQLKPRQLRQLRRDMQIIFQDPFSSLNPRMTVGKILAEPFKIHGLASRDNLQSRIKDLLAIVGLPGDAVDRYPHEFSGGQRQRVGIARAIALNPKLIVADEPVSALDVSIQSQILNLLSDLKAELNLSYIFIAHDLAVVEHISDSVGVMYLGRIVEYAAVDDLFHRPSHPYTQALIAAIPVVDVDNKKPRQLLAGDVPSPMSPPQGCHFHPRCPMATAKCRQESPQLRNIGSVESPHWMACHYGP